MNLLPAASPRGFRHMINVDDLVARADESPDEIIEIILTLDEFSEDVRGDLSSASFEITSTENAEFGFVYGRMRLGDVANLERVRVTGRAEPDAIQEAF